MGCSCYMALKSYRKFKKKSSSTDGIYVCALKKTVETELQLNNTLGHFR